MIETDGNEAVAEFIGALQRCLAVSEIEDAFLAAGHAIIGADAIGLYLFEGADEDSPRSRATADPEFMRDYEERGRDDDPVLRFVLEHTLPTACSRIPVAQWRSSGAYGVLTKAGLGRSMEGPITLAGTVVGTVNFARETGSVAFDRTSLQRVRFICEHVSLALERAQRHAFIGSRTVLFQAVLDRLGTGVVLTDAAGTAIWTSAAGEDTLALPAEGGGTIGERLGDLLTEFEAAGRRTLTSTLRRRDGGRVIVKTQRLPGAGELFTELHPTEPDTSDRLPAWDVLSPREQEIATMVSQGLSTREIAELAFVSQNTVKQHLKRIFAKTDVRNRAELIQLIWSTRRAEFPG